MAKVQFEVKVRAAHVGKRDRRSSKRAIVLSFIIARVRRGIVCLFLEYLMYSKVASRYSKSANPHYSFHRVRFAFF